MTSAWTPVLAPQNIVVDDVRFTEIHPPARTTHLFVVERQGSDLLLHVAPAEYHKDIVQARHIDASAIVGGGLLCRIDDGGPRVLWLGGKSGDFAAIPPQAQAAFVRPLAQMLCGRGIGIDDVRSDRQAMGLNAFWR